MKKIAIEKAVILENQYKKEFEGEKFLRYDYGYELLKRLIPNAEANASEKQEIKQYCDDDVDLYVYLYVNELSRTKDNGYILRYRLNDGLDKVLPNRDKEFSFYLEFVTESRYHIVFNVEEIIDVLI